MAVISAFRVTQQSQIFKLFFRNRIQCIMLYQLLNFKALPYLRRGYFRNSESASFTKLLKSLLTLSFERNQTNLDMFSELKALVDSEKFRVIILG